jgi:hypothetical protein
MADIISFSKARKTKARAAKEQTASENRAKFGRTKADKQREAAETARTGKGLDGHLLKDE